MSMVSVTPSGEHARAEGRPSRGRVKRQGVQRLVARSPPSALAARSRRLMEARRQVALASRILLASVQGVQHVFEAPVRLDRWPDLDHGIRLAHCRGCAAAVPPTPDLRMVRRRAAGGRGQQQHRAFRLSRRPRQRQRPARRRAEPTQLCLARLRQLGRALALARHAGRAGAALLAQRQRRRARRLPGDRPGAARVATSWWGTAAPAPSGRTGCGRTTSGG